MNIQKFFDEMNISDMEKVLRIQASTVISERIYTLLQNYSDGHMPDSEFLNALADCLLTADNLSGQYDTTEENIRIISEIAKSVVDTTKNGKSDYAYSMERAQAIAVNEVNRASNAYSHEMAKKMGYSMHKWVSHGDKTTRSSHRQANGQWHPIDIPFQIGQYKMLFPMDTSYGAPIDEIINCRCVETFFARDTHSV